MGALTQKFNFTVGSMNALFQKFNIEFKVIQSAPHNHETGRHEKGPRRALEARFLMNDTAAQRRAEDRLSRTTAQMPYVPAAVIAPVGLPAPPLHAQHGAGDT